MQASFKNPNAEEHCTAQNWLRAINDVRTTCPAEDLEKFDSITRSYINGLVAQGYDLTRIDAHMPLSNIDREFYKYISTIINSYRELESKRNSLELLFKLSSLITDFGNFVTKVFISKVNKNEK